jgi:hypothetical protein
MKAKAEKIKVKKNNVEDLRFHREIPIRYENVNLGKVKIEYEINEDLLKDPELYKEKGFLNVVVFAELAFLSLFLEDDIELAIRFDEQKREDMKKFGALLRMFYSTPDKPYNQFLYYLINEDVVFKLINTEGPMALRNSFVHMMLEYWLSDREIAGEHINKLQASLMGYSYGDREVPLKTGRPEVKIMKELGTEWVENMYKEISSILKIVKKEGCSPHTAFVKYVVNLVKKYKKDPTDEIKGEKIQRLKKGMQLYEDMDLPDPISACVEKDEYLFNQLNSKRWEPNYFAKEIIAKLLDISVSKVESVLYRKEKES